MISRWMLGAVAATGLGAGAVLAGPLHPAHQGASQEAISEANQLYQRELALNAESGHLGSILGADRTRASTATSLPTTGAPTGPRPGVQFDLVAAPASPAVVAPRSTAPGGAVTIPAPIPAPAPASVETGEESDGPATTTTTAPVSTTTAPVSTTTTSPPYEGDD